VVAGVLTVDPGSVWKVALKSFSEKRVEWFVLTCADVDAADGKSNYVFHAFKVVVCLRCGAQKPRCISPKVNDSLDRRPRLKDLDGQGDMRDGLAPEQRHGELLDDVGEHSFLFVECFLVSANKAAALRLFKPMQTVFFLSRQISKSLHH